jgi:DNA polymerase III subunit beta
MKNTFVVEQKPLLSILSSIQPICTKRTTIDATSSILFQISHKELVIKSTDLEISLQASYILQESDLSEQQSFLVSGRRIFDLVKELDGAIVCHLENEQLRLTSGSVELALNIKDSADFPPFPERIENLMHFDSKVLLELFNKVAFLIPQNSANPALNGLLLEFANGEMRMTSTDGHCLVQARSSLYSLEEEKKWLLPRRAIFELKKILESCAEGTIFLGVCSNQLVFSGESFNFFTKLLADPFPHYQPILEKKDFIPAAVDRVTFMKTLRRSACLLSGQFIATRFDFLPAQKLRVSMLNKEVGSLEEELSLSEFTGPGLEIRFYAPYLLSGLQVFPREVITFYLKNSAKPIIFESTEEHYQLLYLVMPVASSTNG